MRLNLSFMVGTAESVPRTATAATHIRREIWNTAALCWRENRTLLTFDWDFFDTRVIPRHRSPGIVIVDCDNDSERDVALAIGALGEYERLRGAVSKKTRVVVRSDRTVTVWTTADSRQSPNFRFKFVRDRPPMVWID